jgi:hypothetical protein
MLPTRVRRQEKHKEERCGAQPFLWTSLGERLGLDWVQVRVAFGGVLG